MRRALPYLPGVLILALIVGGTAGYAAHRNSQFRNFRIVQDGVLYRSGMLPLAGLKSLIHDHDIKTVVTLRDAYVPGKTPPDLAEEQFCLGEAMNYVRITPRLWWAPDGSVPAEEGVRQFLAVMDEPSNYPVLIHCFAGSHRTGAHCAIYRMEYQHWTNAEAIQEMKECGYANIAEEFDILGYLEQYQPRWARTAAPLEQPVSSKSFYHPVKHRKRKKAKESAPAHAVEY